MKTISLPEEILSRRATVYVRQSTGSQVVENLESQRLQYEMADHVRSAGFNDVIVIDSDLGVSASGTMDRPGFRTLVGQVGKRSSGLEAHAARTTAIPSPTVSNRFEVDVALTLLWKHYQCAQESVLCRRLRSWEVTSQDDGSPGQGCQDVWARTTADNRLKTHIAHRGQPPQATIFAPSANQ